MVTLLPTDGARAIIDRYKREWDSAGRSREALPLMGVMRLVVLADTDSRALKTAERAYAAWLAHMRFLWEQHGLKFALGYSPQIGPMLEVGAAFAGTAAGFRSFVARNVESIGANYLTCDVAFGDMSFDEAMRTTELIGTAVIPAFVDSTAASAR